MTACVISGRKPAEVGNGTVTMLGGLRHGNHGQNVASMVVDLKVYLGRTVFAFDSAEGREKRFGAFFQGILIRTSSLVRAVGDSHSDSWPLPVCYSTYT